MVVPTGSVVLRQHSDILPPPLPHEYAFLFRRPLPDRTLHVRHPRTLEVLISLSAWDHEDGALHFGLVHNACAIIAGNRHDGYLSQSTNASAPRVTMKHAELLPAQSGAYFYHVSGESDSSIVQTFDLWHDPLSLPFAWTWLEQDDVLSCVALVEHAPSVSSCSKTCRLSNHSTAVMPCPPLPVESNPVYLGNDTHGYDQDINSAVAFSGPSAVQYVYLDANLRHTFTNGVWTFFPKHPGTFVAHFLKPVADQAALYHNATTRFLGCELRALCQGFARSVLALRHGHLSQFALKNGDTSETAWAGHDVELEHGVDSVVLSQEGCDITYQGATTKRQRILSFATDSSLEATVPSVSLDNSDESDGGLVRQSAPTSLSPQNGA